MSLDNPSSAPRQLPDCFKDIDAKDLATIQEQRSTLEKGSRGSGVEALQRVLVATLADKYAGTTEFDAVKKATDAQDVNTGYGLYGPKTKQLVTWFQQTYEDTFDIKYIDGKVGREMRGIAELVAVEQTRGSLAELENEVQPKTRAVPVIPPVSKEAPVITTEPLTRETLTEILKRKKEERQEEKSQTTKIMGIEVPNLPVNKERYERLVDRVIDGTLGMVPDYQRSVRKKLEPILVQELDRRVRGNEEKINEMSEGDFTRFLMEYDDWATDQRKDAQREYMEEHVGLFNRLMINRYAEKIPKQAEQVKQWGPVIITMLKERGMEKYDAEVFAQINKESGWDPKRYYATGREASVGFMQINTKAHPLAKKICCVNGSVSRSNIRTDEEGIRLQLNYALNRLKVRGFMNVNNWNTVPDADFLLPWDQLEQKLLAQGYDTDPKKHRDVRAAMDNYNRGSNNSVAQSRSYARSITNSADSDRRLIAAQVAAAGSSRKT